MFNNVEWDLEVMELKFDNNLAYYPFINYLKYIL